MFPLARLSLPIAKTNVKGVTNTLTRSYHVNKAILVGRVGADPLWYEFSNQMSSSSSSASSTSSTPIEPNNSNNPPSQRRGFFHFSLATSKPVLKRNENNESVREVATTWHRIQAFSGGDGNNPAVKILESGKIRKGTLLYVEGTINHRMMKDRDGNEREVTNIQAGTIGILSQPLSQEAELPTPEQ